jgi:three-Cys-motif partner protein
MLNLPPPEDDGLYIPDVGPWSADKHHFLRRYIDAFTTAMKDKPWKGLNYIDLFAGAGIERIEGKRLDWGSPLIAAQATHRFTNLYLCELKKNRHSALTERLQKHPQPNPPTVLQGDANKLVHEIVRRIARGTLSLAFLDPHGLHLHFSTLRTLAAHRVDLIVFFPDFLDAVRNWKPVYFEDPRSNLDLVLGTGLWREKLQSSAKQRWADELGKLYEQQIGTLGYAHFQHERISLPGGQYLYKLIFCSRSKAGATIWRNIARRHPGGQDTLPFE